MIKHGISVFPCFPESSRLLVNCSEWVFLLVIILQFFSSFSTPSTSSRPASRWSISTNSGHNRRCATHPATTAPSTPATHLSAGFLLNNLRTHPSPFLFYIFLSAFPTIDVKGDDEFKIIVKRVRFIYYKILFPPNLCSLRQTQTF